MGRTLLLTLLHFGLVAGNRLFADVVTLKDGRQISGSVESGNTQQLLLVWGSIATIDIHDVQVIQLGVTSSAAATAAAGPAPDQPNTLFLNDGTHITGRGGPSTPPTYTSWSIISFSDTIGPTLAVTFGNAALPAPAARSTTQSAVAVQPPASAAQPAPAPKSARPSAATPQQAPTQQAPTQQTPTQQTPTLARPSGAAAPSRGVSQPDEVGMVDFWNGRLRPARTQSGRRT